MAPGLPTFSVKASCRVFSRTLEWSDGALSPASSLNTLVNWKCGRSEEWKQRFLHTGPLKMVVHVFRDRNIHILINAKP